MIDYILNALATPFVLLGTTIAGLITPVPVDNAPILGAALPQAVAVFETSLAAPISSSATSMELAANAIRGGGSLSGYNCFTVDEGSSQAETICGTVSGTTVSGLQRGISQATGTTTVAALQFAHRRGANVKITDFPVIQIIKAQLNGEDTIPNAIRYATSVATSTVALNDQNLASVGYVNYLSFGGVVGASESAAGFVELATGGEAASSTLTGDTGARLSLSTSLSTTTAPTSGHVIPVTGTDGNIAEGFLPTSLSQSYTLSASTTLTGTTTASTTKFFSESSSSTTLPALWSLLVATTSTANLTTFEVPNIPSRKLLKVYMELDGTDDGVDLKMQFNNDTLSNYNSIFSPASTTVGSFSTTGGSYSVLQRVSYPGGGTVTRNRFFSLDIIDGNNTNKAYVGNSITMDATTTAPLAADISGTWATTTAGYIHKITIRNDGGGGVIQAGSKIYIYGSNF